MSDNIIRTGLNLMNTAFNGQGGTVISGDAVKGGYFVTPSIEITDKGEEGKIPDYACVLGTLCYCSTDKKFYQYLPVTEEKDGATITVNKWVNVRLNDVAERLDAEIARATSVEAKLSNTIKSEGIRITEDLTSIREEANKEAHKVSTLIGGQQDEDKSVRTIANEELAAQLLSDNADASFKTLQELAVWIENHPEDVAAINAAIQQLEKDLAKEKQRSKKKDDELLAKIDEETERAVFEEQRLTERADKADRRLVGHDEQFETLNQTLAEEIERAESVEKELSEALADEQKRIDDNEDKWSRDQDTQYAFNIDGPALTITETTYVNGEGEAKAPISFTTISEQQVVNLIEQYTPIMEENFIHNLFK